MMRVTSGGYLILGMVAVVAAMTAIGLRTRGLFGALLLVQAGYWAISYVVRPLVLYVIQPKPRFNDPIARTILRWQVFRDRRRAAALEPRPCTECAQIIVGIDDAYLFEDLPSYVRKPRAFCSEACWREWSDGTAI